MPYYILVHQNDYIVSTMKKTLQVYHEKLQQLIAEEYLPAYYQKLDVHQDLISTFDKAVKDLMGRNYLKMSKTQASAHFADYKQVVEEVLGKHLKNRDILDFDSRFTSYNEGVDAFVNGIEEVITREQKPERFSILPEDSVWVGGLKRGKILVRKITGIPLLTLNFFRKLFKKTPKTRKTATHKIKLQALVNFFYKERLSQSLLEFHDDYCLAMSKSVQLLWQIDEQLTQSIDNYLHDDQDFTFAVQESQKIDEAKALVENCKDKLQQKANQLLSGIEEEFINKFERVGTVELSNRKFSFSKANKLHRRVNNTFLIKDKQWNNTFIALSDDWEIDLELYAVIYRGLSIFYKNVDDVYQKIDDRIAPSITAIHQTVGSVLESIRSTKREDSQAIQQVLTEQKKILIGQLDNDLIPTTIQVILDQDIPTMINTIEASINEKLQGLSEKRAVVKGESFDAPIRSGSLNYIAPNELISFESIPRFSQAVKTCKIEVSQQLDQIQKEINQIGQIATYNIETALSIEEGQDNVNHPLDIAKEGLERTSSKITAIVEQLNHIKELFSNDLFVILEKLNAEIAQLTNNENILEIRVRIAKAKTVEKGKRLRNEWWNKIKNILPSIWKKWVSIYQKKKEEVHELFVQYGLSKEAQDISSEIADFLSETQNATEKLPFVYQRLFSTVPLEDEHLFEGRKVELNNLHHAYNNFMKGRFASSVIIGEVGSGITTMIYFFKKELGTSCDWYHLRINDVIYDEVKLLSFFEKKLEKSFQSIDELVDFLNSGKKSIIVVESLQKLFLKKVSGFEALKKFMEIVSLTSHKIFWVVSSAKYTWDYLEKTIRVNDHFGYKVEMQPLGDEMITELILNRHEISGFNLVFEPARENLNSKRFKKLSEAERQKYLKQEYFKDLNKIAKSNISLALIYWLRSTHEVSQDTIYISSMKEIDLSFIQMLSTDKLHALVLLLLHDGISIDDFCQSMHVSNMKARSLLFPLLEDGILSIEQNDEKEDLFNINPLVFRQVVDLLRIKNILH